MRHGEMPAPTVDQLTDTDPEMYLAGGPLAPDLCKCDGLCRCDQQTAMCTNDTACQAQADEHLPTCPIEQQLQHDIGF